MEARPRDDASRRTIGTLGVPGNSLRLVSGETALMVKAAADAQRHERG